MAAYPTRAVALARRHRLVLQQQIHRLLLPRRLVERQRVLRRQPMLDHQARQQQAAGIAALRAERRAFPGHQRRRRGVIERAGGQAAALLLLGIGGDRLDEALDAIERGAQQALVLAGQRMPSARTCP